MPPPDPPENRRKAAEWMRKRVTKFRHHAEVADDAGKMKLSEYWDWQADALRDAADAYEKGDEP